MSPCDIPSRVRIFLILSPIFLLINIIIAYEILHFQTILYYNPSIVAANQNQKFPFHFLSAPPPDENLKKGRKIFGFVPRPKGADEARNPSGRFSFKPPHAPRVRNGFAQRLIHLRRKKLLNPKGGKKPAPKAREWAKEPVAPRRIGTE